MSFNCLLIEDEKLAQDVLEKYIGLMPSLHLSKVCSGASEAISYLHTNSVDLIFLDINMPELNGIDFLKTLKQPPLIIITTAYPEFALEGYEFSVCDFLLKPIRYERFVKAINSFIDRINTKMKSEMTENNKDLKDFIFIKEDQVIHKIYHHDLLFVQAFGNYLKIITRNSKPIISRMTMHEIDSFLPDHLFVRVHKSYIVGIQAVDRIQYNEIHIQNMTIPVGTTYRQAVLHKMKC